VLASILPRDAVATCLSVTQSVCHTLILYRNRYRYHQTFFSAC